LSWTVVDDDRVAKGYVRLRRDDLMLLPIDVRDWLPVDHVVWFLLDAVEALDTSLLHRRARLGGAGRSPYDPDMLLALLIYAYAGGLRSSRKIERRCREDAAFMVISGLCRPDHATISRFRKDNDAAMEELFAEVLALCGRAGMGSLEHVAIDGTKVVADAARAQSRDVDGLRRVARRLLDEAAAVDVEEDARYGAARGDELPEELRDPVRRREVIKDLVRQAGEDPDRRRGRSRRGKAGKAERALALADEIVTDAKDAAQAGLQRPQARLARSQATLAAVRAEVQARNNERAAREAEAAAAGRTLPGTRPVDTDEHVHVRRALAKVNANREALTRRESQAIEVVGRRNLTDPDSRFMPVTGGFILGYNCQLAVAADHLILAVDVVQDPGDSAQLVPMFDKLGQAVQVLRDATANPDLTVEKALLDAGYATIDNFLADGPDRLIALGKRSQIAGEAPPTSPPDELNASPRQKMAWRLSTPEGRKAYKKRGATVEPVNGHLKDQRGMRRFSRRGLTAALAELRFASLTTNLLRLHTTSARITQTA
jgi:transposase